jgi:hypothetical protein
MPIYFLLLAGLETFKGPSEVLSLNQSDCERFVRHGLVNEMSWNHIRGVECLFLCRLCPPGSSDVC